MLSDKGFLKEIKELKVEEHLKYETYKTSETFCSFSPDSLSSPALYKNELSGEIKLCGWI